MTTYQQTVGWSHFWASPSPNQLIQRWRSDCWFPSWLPDKSLKSNSIGWWTLFFRYLGCIGFVWYGAQVGIDRRMIWFASPWNSTSGKVQVELRQLKASCWILLLKAEKIPKIDFDSENVLSVTWVLGVKKLQQQASRSPLISSKPAATSRWKCKSLVFPWISTPKATYSMSQYFMECRNAPNSSKFAIKVLPDSASNSIWSKPTVEDCFTFKDLCSDLHSRCLSQDECRKNAKMLLFC